MSENPLRAADVLNPNWLPEYEKQRDALSIQLRELNTMLFILEKIELFPFWLFTPHTRDYVFWRTIRFSLIETTIMIASRAILETDKDSLTLKNYKSEIVRNTVDDTAKQAVKDLLRSVNFDKRIAEIEAKIRDIRNNFLAHFDKIQNTLEPEKRTVADITYGEMKELLAAAFDLFNILSFETYFVPWLMDYGDQVRNAQQTDIERLLDYVAKSSHLLKLPERDPEVWQRRRLKLNTEEIKQINYYRTRAGLTEIT
jgi:hypothetical protein